MFCKKWQHVCTWPTTLPPFSTATACRSKEFTSTTQQSFVDLSTRIRGRGGLNCEAKAQVFIVTPSPLFFLEVGRKKGGRNSGAVRYSYRTYLHKCMCCWCFSSCTNPPAHPAVKWVPALYGWVDMTTDCTIPSYQCGPGGTSGAHTTSGGTCQCSYEYLAQL